MVAHRLQCFSRDMGKFHVWIQALGFILEMKHCCSLISPDRRYQVMLFLTPSTTIIKVLPVRLCNPSRKRSKSMLSWQYNISFSLQCLWTSLEDCRQTQHQCGPMLHVPLKTFSPSAVKRQQSVQVSVHNLVSQSDVVCTPLAGVFSFAMRTNKNRQEFEKEVLCTRGRRCHKRNHRLTSK